MKKLILALCLILAFLSTGFLLAAKGEIVAEKGDHYIVDTGYGYTVMEWYGGAIPSEGDKVVGNLDTYGFKDIYDITRGRETRVYIEDYGLDEEG